MEIYCHSVGNTEYIYIYINKYTCTSLLWLAIIIKCLIIRIKHLAQLAAAGLVLRWALD